MRRVLVITSLVLAGLLPQPGQAAASNCDDPTTLVGPVGPLPVSPGSCPGVRPGAFVRTPVGGCSFNFVFSGSDGDTYIGTAAHCITGGGEQVWARGAGPTARDASNRHIGEFAYSLLEHRRDFALIRVFDGIDVNPAMCHFGGPASLYEEHEDARTILRHYGNGIGVGDTVPARSAVLWNTIEPDYTAAHGVALFGDSGSGIMTAEGGAFGVIVHLRGSIAGAIGITRLPGQLARAEAALGISLELVTAPLAE